MKDIKINIVKEWYKYLLFAALTYIFVMSILQLISEFRIFSFCHILLCIAIVVSMYISFRYFKIILKTWGSLLIISGGLIILSSLMYLLAGAIEKISLEGNAIGVINFLLGIFLYKYLEQSVHPIQ